MQQPEFWQLLLAAEAPPAKSRAFIEGLDSSFLEPLDYLRNHPDWSPNERKRVELARLEPLRSVLGSGARVLTEDEYPEVLRQGFEWVPPAIFVHGNEQAFKVPTVGIVGTRSATAYGKACAHKFAEALALAGVTIVSGGALGIDAAAHRGALAAGGATVAVLAGGIDHVYPAVHAGLFTEMKTNGCLVSQFAAGQRPTEYKFLARNVLIAALSQALIVVQAPMRSGALSTAHAAADLGREVFVVPANIDSHDFRGSFNLIRDGATLVYHPHQVLDALGISGPEAREMAPVAPLGQRILNVLSLEPTDTERIVEQTGLSAGEVLAELTMLELDGHIARDAGGYVIQR